MAACERYWDAENYTSGQWVVVHSESEHEDWRAAEREAHEQLVLAATTPGGPRCETFWLASEEVQRWLAERRHMGVTLRRRIEAMRLSEQFWLPGDDEQVAA